MQRAHVLKPIQRGLGLFVAAMLVLLFIQRGADAGPKTIATVSGGPVSTPTYTSEDQVGEVEVTIPLNGSPSYTFTQKAGEVIIIAAEATLTESAGTSFCGARLFVRGVENQNVFPNSSAWVGMEMSQHTNKGDYGLLTDSETIPAPAAERQISIEAVVVEGERNDPHLEAFYGPGDTCDGFGPGSDPENPDYDPGQDSWTASVRVSIASLR
ncbi:MAG TPA: hypothetical protein VHH54_01610 [Actinomycetota bacterium]|nr:hypothetical protein [Actinomycetota bacterium]